MSRVPFWSSLRVRVVLGVVLPLTVALGLVAYLQYVTHRELMLETLQEFSAGLGESVEASLERAMLGQDRVHLSQVAQDLAASGSVRSLMILDHTGVVRIATRQTDLNTRILADDPACQTCHAADARESSRTFVLASEDGSRIFRTVTPILNQVACQSCHDPATQVNGILVLDLPYEPIETHLWADLRQNLILAAVTIVLVALAINFLLNRIVLRKLAGFGSALARYARGDFAARVPQTARDEIGELAATVNRMADGLQEKEKLELEVERTAHKLERESASLGALYRGALESSRSLNLHDVMHAGLANALGVMRMDAGEIHLLEPNGGTLRLRASTGSPAAFVHEEELLARGECLCGSVAASGKTCAIGELGPDARVTRLACRRFGFHSVAAIPLQARGATVGVLTLHNRTPRDVTPDELALLSALGDQLGVAIDNARLYAEMESRVHELSRQVQHLAVLEERDRLAREMHDGFAQALVLLNMKLQLAQRAMSGDAQCATNLLELREIVGETYEDVRQAIGDLRTPLAVDTPLVKALSEYVQTFALRYNLQVDVSADTRCDDARCSPDVQIQVTRIVQETMANIRKHAHARQVQIAFARRDGHLNIHICDDGQGFDSAATARATGHFGLAIMRERAASFGGTLDLDTQPGAGTTITLDVPLVVAM